MNDYRTWALAQQLAPSTINRRLGFFKHYASWGLEEHFVEASVFRAIKDVALVLVPTRVLLAQWSAEIEAVLDLRVGLYGDGERQLAPVTVSTFESAYRHIG